jgi:hypothetical protein
MQGSRLRRGFLLLGVTAALAAPSGAAAATTVGQTAPTSADVFACGGGTLFLTPAVAPGTPPYEAPTGGVLTSWSAQGGTLLAPGTLKLKVVRPAGANAWEIVDEDPTSRTIPPNVVSTFRIRIPVTGGEFVALWAPPGGGHPCSYETIEDSNLQVWRFGSFPEPAVGEIFPTNSTDVGFRTNVSAVLEPDCDSDGFGDETQDPDTSPCKDRNFSFGKLKRNKKKGTATLPVDVPGPGTLVLTGKGLVKQRLGAASRAGALAKTVNAAGRVKLKVKAKGKKRRRLDATGTVTVMAKITYTPTGGVSNTKAKRIKLVKRL